MIGSSQFSVHSSLKKKDEIIIEKSTSHLRKVKHWEPSRCIRNEVSLLLHPFCVRWGPEPCARADSQHRSCQIAVSGHEGTDEVEKGR